MRQRAIQHLTRPIATALAVLAMALLGGSHEPTPRALLGLAAYALPDGSLPYLCRADGHEQPTPTDRAHDVCLAVCALAAPVGLLTASFTPAAPVSVRERAALPVAAPVQPRVAWAIARARAPPVA